ncbi:cobalamin-binding protein [Porticoccaceae bacterium]|nr:cobalamin-binding protein [Porticoccaceae bacterium]
MQGFLLLVLMLPIVFSSSLLLAEESTEGPVQHSEVSAVDDQGNLVVLPAPAQRIISLAPNLTEVLFYVGAGEQIVGADEYSNYPEAAKGIIRVNNHAAANYELILSLKPDLVVAWESGNGEQIIGRIRELGLPIFVLETRKMDIIPDLFSRLGRLTGHDETAKKRADNFTQRLDGLRKTYSNQPIVRAFYQIWNDPFITLNGEHLVSDVIELCGGVNVFGEAIPLVPYVNIEAIMAADPQVIIASGSSDNNEQWRDSWKDWQGISAVTSGNIYLIPPDLMQRHSSRILDGAEYMCDFLQRARAAN